MDKRKYPVIVGRRPTTVKVKKVPPYWQNLLYKHRFNWISIGIRDKSKQSKTANYNFIHSLEA